MPLQKKDVAEVLGAYFIVSLMILGSNLIPGPNVYGVNLVSGTLSIVFLIPLYLWYRKRQQAAVLSRQIDIDARRTITLRIIALLALAMVVRVPSVLIFGMAYEKTPLIFLLVLTAVVIERSDLSILGFRTEKFGRSVLLGLVYYFLLEFIAVVGMSAIVYWFTKGALFVGFDPAPFLLTMPFMTLAVGISEEGLFRGYIQTHIQEFWGKWTTILLQAVLFGLWHFVWHIAPLNLFDMFLHMTEAFVIGVLFGYFYSISKNLIPLILAHGLSDSFPTSLIQSATSLTSPNLSPTIQLMSYLIPYTVALIVTFISTKFLIKSLLGIHANPSSL